ncbi:MAG: beta-lactamase family protein [Actinobacteria bacterium]|nr:beta-lactamase family protein [Actinomycetota bacterium]
MTSLARYIAPAIVALASACGTTTDGSVGSAATAGARGTAATTGTSAVTEAPTTTAASTTVPAIVSSSTAAAAGPPAAAAAFAATDRALQSRVSSAGLSGGVVYVVRDGQVIHDYSVGSVTRSTPLSVASSAKWITAATMMTYVDEGKAALDDPVSKWLPEFAGESPPVTVRQLLDHTSGVRDQGCLWNAGGRLADCVRLVAASPREFPAGTKFSYGNADFHVIGRVLEVLGGADFATVVQRRISGPLGMGATTWPGAPNNPSPAAGTRTTVDDYARFLAMILGRGMFEGKRLLSASAVDELVRNQVGAYDTSGDYAVGITRIPRYSLGAWPDVVDPAGATVVVSGNGGKGFYPWVDFSTNSYGIVGVQDDRGAQVAVPASQRVAAEARQAVR